MRRSGPPHNDGRGARGGRIPGDRAVRRVSHNHDANEPRQHPQCAVISSRSGNRWVDQDLCVADMSSTQRLHVRPQAGGAVECDRAKVTSVTSWLRRARCRSRSARSAAGPRVQAARRSSVAGRRAPQDPHAPRSDTRPSSRSDDRCLEGAGRVPGSDLGGYVDYIADTLQVTRPRRRLNPSMATSRTPPTRLEICAVVDALRTRHRVPKAQPGAR